MGIFDAMAMIQNNYNNAALTRESWARDDNAVQRRTADLQAAGINPILAAGQGAGNSAPIRMEAPQTGMNEAQMVMDRLSQKKDFAKKDQEITYLNNQNLLMDILKNNASIDNNMKARDLELMKKYGFSSNPTSKAREIAEALEVIEHVPNIASDLRGALIDIFKGMF